MILPDCRRSACVHLQGKHCTKIGSKCIEKRWFNSNPCLMNVHKKVPFIPKRFEGDFNSDVKCSKCDAVWGECEHSKKD